MKLAHIIMNFVNWFNELPINFAGLVCNNLSKKFKMLNLNLVYG